MLRHHARASLQHGDRANVALRVEQLRHADLLAQNACDLRCHVFYLSAQLGSSVRTAIGWECGAGALAREGCGASLRRTAERGRPHINYLCSFPNALISTSTPAGRSSFISASTVCCVGSRISSRRLCVRISNCSRDFLSTCGERNTVVRLMVVGRGIGPATSAPVRFAVSTISRVDWSRIL